jgi:hypothetical protein
MRSLIARAAVLPLLLAAGCGPIMGQTMKSSTGVKDFQVREGTLGDFKTVKHVLVFAPFTKGEKGYFICRGDDEWLIADGFKRTGLFETDYAFERDADRAAATLAELRAATPGEAQSRLGLSAAPDAILSGSVLERDETVAPTVGVIQDLRLRLDLTVLATHRTTSIEVAVKAVHRDAIPMMVKEIERRVRSAG